MANRTRVIYWDTSAILSSVFSDSYSETAKMWIEREAVHFISTLAFAEFCAVISRIQRERLLNKIMTQSVFEILDNGPWRRIYTWPEFKIINTLSTRWPLRGADLWHLALAKSLNKEFPELYLLSFDNRLQKAAEGESLCQPDI